jgi:hypothetical protein
MGCRRYDPHPRELLRGARCPPSREPRMTPVVVRGPVTAEELAAVVAALALRRTEAPVPRYERWRRARLAALRG